MVTKDNGMSSTKIMLNVTSKLYLVLRQCLINFSLLFGNIFHVFFHSTLKHAAYIQPKNRPRRMDDELKKCGRKSL
jgi:hypothetical protein